MSYWEDTRASSDGQSERERKCYDILFHKSSFEIVFHVRTGVKLHGIRGQSHHVLGWAHRLFQTRQPSIGDSKQGLGFVKQFMGIASCWPWNVKQSIPRPQGTTRNPTESRAATGYELARTPRLYNYRKLHLNFVNNQVSWGEDHGSRKEAMWLTWMRAQWDSVEDPATPALASWPMETGRCILNHFRKKQQQNSQYFWSSWDSLSITIIINTDGYLAWYFAKTFPY